MAHKRRIGVLIVLGTMTVFTVAALVTPAYGVVSGPCTGSASFSNGAVITAGQPLDPATVIPDMDKDRKSVV